jgi:hypothetical protein
MRLPKARWVIDVLLVTFGVCLFLSVYIINGQYAHACAAVSKAFQEARDESGGDPEKHGRILSDKTRDLPSPETYYQRREAVLWLFLVPLLGSLASRRWVVSTLIFILWMLTWSFHGLRY